jgi:hypothetical protein
MPGGGTALGFAYFAAAKFIGYTAFCHWIIEPRALAASSPTLPSSTLSISTNAIEVAELPSAFHAGAARTAIGVAAGSASGLLIFSGFLDHLGNDTVAISIFFALLIPIRILEWRLLLWWMYREFPFASSTRWKLVTFGIVTSFALDALGMFTAFVMPGGIWIC